MNDTQIPTIEPGTTQLAGSVLVLWVLVVRSPNEPRISSNDLHS